jgi:deoxyadenosine/deoxycytidine kinase
MTDNIIVIEGIIGAGKSTLAKRIAERHDIPLHLEPVEDNPYLKLFYDDPSRYALEMQYFMLFRRHAAQREAAWRCINGARGVVLDRSLPGDRVFCRAHVDAGNIDELGWQTYEHAFDVMTTDMLPPRLLVFLDVPPVDAWKRVQRRGRQVEETIDIPYLAQLRAGYLDLIDEIESGRHHWSRGITVARVDWSGDPWENVDRVAEVDEIIERALDDTTASGDGPTTG